MRHFASTDEALIIQIFTTTGHPSEREGLVILNSICQIFFRWLRYILGMQLSLFNQTFWQMSSTRHKTKEFTNVIVGHSKRFEFHYESVNYTNVYNDHVQVREGSWSFQIPFVRSLMITVYFGDVTPFSLTRHLDGHQVPGTRPKNSLMSL